MSASALSGGVFAAGSNDELAELRALVNDIGEQAAQQQARRHQDVGIVIDHDAIVEFRPAPHCPLPYSACAFPDNQFACQRSYK